MQEKDFLKHVIQRDMPEFESVRREILLRTAAPSRRFPAIKWLVPTAVCAAVLLAMVLIRNQSPLEPQIPTYQIISGDLYSHL